MTRGRALVAAAMLAGAVLVPAASAQSAAAITLTPTSAPAGTSGTWAITVSGTGFAASRSVNVTFAGTAAGSVTTNAQGAFTLPITPAQRPGGTYQVIATQSFCIPTACFTNTANANFLSVPPLRGYDEPSFAATGEERCGPPGPGFNWSVHVSGTLWPPGGTAAQNTVTAVFYRLEQVVTRITALVTPSGTWQVNGWAVPAQPEAPAGTYSIRASDQRGASARLEWNVPCQPPTTRTTPSTTTPTDTTVTTATTVPTDSTTRPTTTNPGSSTIPTTTTTVPPAVPGVPVLTCSPCIGPPGFVTQLNGTGYPPNAAVALRWAPGLGDKAVTADGAGSFSTQMLVMPGDMPGPRQAVGEVGGGPSASADFLVVPSTVTPSGRDVAQLVRLTQLVHR